MTSVVVATGWRAALIAVGALAAVPAALRWLRVAQREHYLAGSSTRFAWRWWRIGVRSSVLGVLGLAGVVGAFWFAPAAVLPAAAGALGPVGLGVRGRTSPLAWTRRLRTLAACCAVVWAAVLAAGIEEGIGPAVAGALALGFPVVVDAACLITAPLERRLGRRYVDAARSRLRRVAPAVVAITGSYGKTSTKQELAHLVASSRSVVATPASFNNRAGLARAVNEHLVDGTEVFVAEMGTYGPGEIAELVEWIPPDIATITAIGPVHLERFGTEERIVAAKAEILEPAGVVVLPVDDPRLAALADRAEAQGKQVWRVSARKAGSDGEARERGRHDATDVMVTQTGPDRLSVVCGGQELAHDLSTPARAGNVAVAVALALALGVAPAEIGRRLGSLPTVAHRLEPVPSTSGALVLDDTYNANPAGARAALDALATAGAPGGRRVVVTPGMVELGARQGEENARFAEAAASVASDLVVVGRTNRRALLQGVEAARRNGATCAVVTVAHRDDAVAWVRQHLGPGDVVVYENDLPDHYP